MNPTFRNKFSNLFAPCLRGGAFVSLFFLLLVSCSEERLPEGAQFSFVRQHLAVRTTSVAFGYHDNLTASVGVEGENTVWKLTGVPDWLTASATSGQGAATITLTAQENTSPDESRAALLTFTSTAEDYQYVKTISVSQPAAAMFVTPSAQTLSFVAAGEGKLVTVEANVEWTAETTASWITISKANSGQLSITADENLGAARTSNIYLRRTGTSTTLATISVSQLEAGITGSEEEMIFEVDGESHTTTIHAEASWTAYASDASWITISPEGGNAGDATLTIRATANGSANARSGHVYVRIGTSNKLAIPVRQDGIKYQPSANSISLKSTAEATTLDFEANARWTLISKPDWLDIDPTEGAKGTTTLTITPQDNPETTQRTGSIVLGREGFSGNRTISVAQDGKTFDALTTQMDFPNTASTQSLSIETDGQWTATTQDTWIHLSPTSGTGKGTLTVACDANLGETSRTGHISVTVGKATQQIAIVQSGSSFSISYDALLTNSKPATIRFSILSNLKWTATSTSAWLTADPTEGNGDATVLLAVADNASPQSRTGSVVFKTDKETKNVAITQPGRSLTVSTTEITFTEEGGTSAPVTVTTDGTYTVSSSEEWLTINQSGNTFTAHAAANTGEARKATITVALSDLNEGEVLSRTITVSQEVYIDPLEGLCPDANHPHLIDLGLSVKWSCCNIGTHSPTGYGTYYAWGETSGSNAGKTTFAWSNYKWGTSETALTRYNNLNDSYGTVDHRDELEPADDAAYQNRGSSWRMPSMTQMNELRTKCTWTWTVRDGIPGYDVKGSNGNCIFLPATGYMGETESKNVGAAGYYWLRTLNEYGPSKARCVNFYSSGVYTDVNDRCQGRPVRPVECGTYLVVSYTTQLADAKGTTVPITISSNTSWTASTPNSWLELNRTSYEGNAVITLTVHTNTNTTERTGTIVFQTDAETKTIPITQPAAETSAHEYVDLGLPSGTLWATTNVGADTPEATGDYFAWGETSGFESGKTTFNWSNYKYCNGSSSTLTKYCNKSNYGADGFTDTMEELQASDDAATVCWGSEWCTPSQAQLEELINSEYTTAEWTTQNGVSGRKITSKSNGRSIFLPVTGYRSGTSISYGSSYGYYWSRTLSTSFPFYASNLSFYASSVNTGAYSRYNGQCIRPVRSSSQSTAEHAYVNLGLPSGTLWATKNIGASKPEDYGDYFAWGETSGFRNGKTNFDWTTYKWCNGSSTTLTKYNTYSSYGTIDNKTELELSDDAAYVNWGSNWRMPSLDQFEELINSNYTTTTWTTVNGVYGRRITSKMSGYTGEYIFLPAAGYRSGASLHYASLYYDGSYGDYRSRTLLASKPYDACSLNFNSSGVDWSYSYRYYGQSVRPVRNL